MTVITIGGLEATVTADTTAYAQSVNRTYWEQQRRKALRRAAVIEKYLKGRLDWTAFQHELERAEKQGG